LQVRRPFGEQPNSPNLPYITYPNRNETKVKKPQGQNQFFSELGSPFISMLTLERVPKNADGDPCIRFTNQNHLHSFGSASDVVISIRDKKK